MASSSNSQVSAASFTFSTPIKLDRSNYIIWKSQVVSSIKGNGLEHLIENKVVPEGFDLALWNRQDQMLLSWLMSSMSMEILVLVASSESSFELWKRLEKQFGSETEAKKVQLKAQLTNFKKGNLSLSEYFAKLKSLTDNLAVAGHIVSSSDFITHLITPLGQEYDPVVVLITANLANMSVDDAYGTLFKKFSGVSRI